MPRFESPRPYELQLLTRDDVRIERNISRVGVLPQYQILASVATELDAFVHGGRVSHAFDHDVGAIGSGFGQNGASPVGWGRQGCDIGHPSRSSTPPPYRP